PPPRSNRRSLIISPPLSPPPMFPCPDKAPEGTPGSPGGGGSAALDATTANGDLGAVSPGPPPASPASAGSLDTESVSSEGTPEGDPGHGEGTAGTASVSSEETPERDPGHGEGTSVTVSVSSDDTPECDPRAASVGTPATPDPSGRGGDSGARGDPEGIATSLGGPEGIATSLASLILSEAVARATGTAPPEPGTAAATAATGGEGRMSPRPDVPRDVVREPGQPGGAGGQRGDSAEGADAEPR
ncbi:bridging integrator 2-like, partial [Neopelma chrysocephalum]|uniref:bridging integrator 2-like n=1 Tax=Neopelma chrysocephalum TaxID=114329 RepID=UPI000FCCE726